MPPRIAQVLGVARTLIAYGKNLSETLNDHASQPHTLPFFGFVAKIFVTKVIAVILARITRGLLRAAALEQRLQNRAARGRDIQPASVRPPSPRKRRAAEPATSPASHGPYRANLPTLAQIFAQDRRRPIRAILVDICLDLGIIPGQMDRASWNELVQDLTLYSRDLENLLVWRHPRAPRPRNPKFLPVSIPGQTGLIFPSGRRHPHDPRLSPAPAHPDNDKADCLARRVRRTRRCVVLPVPPTLAGHSFSPSPCGTSPGGGLERTISPHDPKSHPHRTETPIRLTPHSAVHPTTHHPTHSETRHPRDTPAGCRPEFG
jgi:hypothetical protein